MERRYDDVQMEWRFGYSVYAVCGTERKKKEEDMMSVAGYYHSGSIDR